MLEGDKIAQIEYDFRSIFHVDYYDVSTLEAIHLIAQLGAGSRYRAACDIRLSWTRQDELMACIVDSVERFIRLYATQTTEDAVRIIRPGENQKSSSRAKKFKNVEKFIEETEWEEV